MMTLSIIAGLITTIGVGAGATQRSAIAVTIIGGQSLCLLLTLIVTPVAYSLLSELSEMKLIAGMKPSRLRLSASRFFGLFIH
jgi:Cu/Ag efflux pump CusA